MTWIAPTVLIPHRVAPVAVKLADAEKHPARQQRGNGQHRRCLQDYRQ